MTSTEVAIQFFKNHLKDEPLKYGERQAIHMAIAALREQPRWIPVTERLPTDERKVLVCYGFDSEHNGDLGVMFVGTLTYFCFDSNPHWQHSSSCNIVVTHWMPLPEPPKEGV